MGPLCMFKFKGECGIDGEWPTVYIPCSKENVGWMENVSTVHVHCSKQNVGEMKNGSTVHVHCSEENVE